MPIRALVLLLAVFIQQLPPPFRLALVPEGHARRRHARRPPAHGAGGLHRQSLRRQAAVRALHGARAQRRRVPRRAGHEAPAGSRSCATRDRDGVAETRETFATGLNRPFGLAFWKNYLYVGNNDSVVRFTYTTGQTEAGERAGEDRRSAGERRRARSGHRESAEDRHQPDARLQPLDEQRHLQSGRHQAVRHRRIGHQRHARERDGPARRDQRIQPGRQRASRVRQRAAQSGGPGVFSRNGHALDGGQRARSPRRRSRAGLHHVGAATAASTAGRIPTSASIVDPTVKPAAAGPGRDGIAPGRAAAVALGGARAALLHRLAVPGGVPQPRVRRAARIDQPIEAVRLLASCACRSATDGRPVRPKSSSPASSPATTRRRRRGAGRWACCSCRTDRCSCRTMAAIACGA